MDHLVVAQAWTRPRTAPCSRRKNSAAGNRGKTAATGNAVERKGGPASGTDARHAPSRTGTVAPGGRKLGTAKERIPAGHGKKNCRLARKNRRTEARVRNRRRSPPRCHPAVEGGSRAGADAVCLSPWRHEQELVSKTLSPG